MTYEEAKKLKEGDYVWVHTSVVRIRSKRWIRARVLTAEPNAERRGTMNIVIRTRSFKKWLCNEYELKKAKPKQGKK